MRPLGANAFTLKTTDTERAAGRQKAAWPQQPLPEQKSLFRGRNRRIPFLALNKNCSGPSLLLWNILLTGPIKTTAAKHTHTHVGVAPPPTPTARQRRCKATSPGFKLCLLAGARTWAVSTQANTCWKEVETGCHVGPTFNNAYLQGRLTPPGEPSA